MNTDPMFTMTTAEIATLNAALAQNGADSGVLAAPLLGSAVLSQSAHGDDLLARLGVR